MTTLDAIICDEQARCIAQIMFHHDIHAACSAASLVPKHRVVVETVAVIDARHPVRAMRAVSVVWTVDEWAAVEQLGASR